MAGKTLYDWYSILHEASDLIESGKASNITELAEALGVPRGTLDNALKRELNVRAQTIDKLPGVIDEMDRPDPEVPGRPERRDYDVPPVEEGPEDEVYSFAEDGSRTIERIIQLSEGDMDDPVVIMRKMGLDPIRWEMLTYEIRRGASQVTMKLSQGSDKNGNKAPEIPHTVTNYNVKCKVKVRPLQDKVSAATIRAVFDELQPPKLRGYKYEPSDLMLELGFYDIHIGKQAWEDETGEENYDLDIAQANFQKAVESLISRVTIYGLQLERILFPVGQDFYHIDNSAETTTRGTKVDTDDRWQKIYQVGLECLVFAIEELRKLAPVDVLYVPGNHDEQLSFFATMHLDAYFKDVEAVTVDTLPTTRKYRRFGNNLIGFSHGKEGKRIEKLMQVEAAKDWGDTLFREFHLGDLHHERAKEDGGIIFRRISALTATDAWHAEKGYKGAIRKAQAFVWSREDGLEAILNVGV